MKLNDFSNKIRWQASDGGQGGQSATPDPNAAPATPDFGFVPADFQAEGKPDWSKFSAHYQDLVARDAQFSDRQSQVPEDGAYEWALPQDFKLDGLELPDGYSPSVAADDEALKPIFADLGAALKEWGIPKEGSAKLMGMLARYEATRQSQAFAAAKADMAALGTPAQQQARVGAVERLIDARLPADQAKSLKAAFVPSAAAVRALEALLGPRGGTTPNPQPPGPSTENMTASQRLEQANGQFFEAGNRRRTA